MALLLALPALWAQPVPLTDASTLSWPAWAQAWALHPDQGWRQPPWVWWTTAWLHGSPEHLHHNLAGAALLAWMGWATGTRAAAAVAWLAAWPLTQVGMLWPSPALHTYIGLSGVLHAGLVIWCLAQFTPNSAPALRWTAAGLLCALAAKIVMENPWQHTLIAAGSSAITVAPWAHWSGALCGAALSLLMRGLDHLATPRQPSVHRRTLK